MSETVTTHAEPSTRETAEREYKALTKARLRQKIAHLRRTLRRPLPIATQQRILIYFDVAIQEAQRRGL